MKPKDNTTGFKMCMNEKIEKPVSGFSIKNTGHYSPDCKSCVNKKAKEKYANRHKEVYVQRK